MRPLSDLAWRTAGAALERASADARCMPGNLLPHECLDDLTAAALRIVDEVERLPEAPYDLSGTGERPVDVAVAGLLLGRRVSADLRQLGVGLFLMDLGKLALPPAIADKRGPLDEAELELMRRHPQRGLDLLRHREVGRDARAAILHHHERWDGGGYPAGLAGTDIPQPARIAALADAFAASPSQPEGVDALRAGAGRAFDPALVDAFAELAMARSPGLGASAA